MTYFNYRRVPGKRGDGVYAGSSLVGHVVVKADWRSRLTLGPTVESYSAIGLGGEALPGLFRSRHDAAEALHAVATAGAGDDTTSVRRLSPEGHGLEGNLLGGQ